jgi:hypothetical protein
MNTFNFKSLLPVLVLMLAPLAAHASLSVGISINIAPPELPVYVQPPIPEPGYIWTPGYWAWGPDGYYWVPGTWVLPPRVGFLWTPGYWGWEAGFYVWHVGYWGPHVGFYGGINYGYGYGGVGYEGGYWRGERLYYNRSVNNIGNVRITNVYNTTVINNTTVNRVSYNGGNGGIRRAPSGVELSALRERHVGYTSDQRMHEQGAARDRSFLATVNHGRPAVAVTQRPGAFKESAFSNRGPGSSGAQGAPAQIRRDRPANAQPNVNAGANRIDRTDRPPYGSGPGPQNRYPQNRYPENRYPAPTRELPQNRYPGNSYPAPATQGPRVQPQVRAPSPVREVPRPPQAQPRGPQPAGPQQRGPQPEDRRGPEERDRR